VLVVVTEFCMVFYDPYSINSADNGKSFRKGDAAGAASRKAVSSTCQGGK
jgi:hypothetical protein